MDSNRAQRLLSLRATLLASGATGADGGFRHSRRWARSSAYAMFTLFVTLAGLAAIWRANEVFAPEMYSSHGPVTIGQALARDDNYAVFDLNLNIRAIRDVQIRGMAKTPDVVILGASHWQEFNAELVTTKRLYNSHVHRDYWEDMLGVSEMWMMHGSLPKQMIISIRDNLFTPVEDRKDFLWEPGIPYYRQMALRLGLEPQDLWQTLPFQRMRERLSLSMLFTNITRWFGAEQRPHPTKERKFDRLDTLLADGSIVWSKQHLELFTQARSEDMSLSFAEQRRNDPPKVDPKGVAAVSKLIGFLQGRGVEVILAHPPFNPIYYDRIQGSPYAAGLARIEQITRDLAQTHGLEVIGSFDPAKLGCTADMYIDAEHANAQCLKSIGLQIEKTGGDTGGTSPGGGQ